MSAPSCTTDVDSPACPPLVRRAHKAVIVGLAIFFAVIIPLGEPFRGYQAEVRVSGPSSDAINGDRLREWIRETDPTAAVAVATRSSGASRIEIRIGRVCSRLAAATRTLDDLARQLLVEELPAQHAAHRQAALSALQSDLQIARETEDVLRSRAQELRDAHLAARQLALPPLPIELTPSAAPAAPFADSGTARAPAQTPATGRDERLQQLESLRLELARLLASFTEEHPQVLAIRRQIDSLEQTAPTTEVRDAETPSLDLPPARPATYHDLSQPEFVSVSPSGNDSPAADPAVVAAELAAVQNKLSQAGKNRELIERKLQNTLATLAASSPTAAWSAEPARIVARLGGTPRMLPVILALLSASVAGVIMFRATHVLVLPRVLQSARDLAAALPIPLVGRNPTGGGRSVAGPRTIVTPARVRFVTKASECVLLTILAVCVGAIFLDPTLALQFTDDPLGVMSEIFGRLLGR
jgi:hypothetical protein